MSLDRGLGESEYKEEGWPSLKAIEDVPVPLVEDDERMAKLGEKFVLPEFEGKEPNH